MEFNYKWIEHIPADHSIGDAQVRELFRWASTIDGNAIEIGSFYGRSTAVIAWGLKIGNGGRLFAIDPHENKYNSYEACLKNVIQADVKEYVQIIRNQSENVFREKKPKEIFEKPIDLLFVDGNHTYEGLKKDLVWIDLVRRGGIVAFHDYTSKYPGIIKAITEYQETHHTMIQFPLVGSMILFKKL